MHWKRMMKQKNGHYAIASDERDVGGYLPWEYLTVKHLIYCLLAHGNGTSKLGKPQINSHCICNIIQSRIFLGTIAGSHPCSVEEEKIFYNPFQDRYLCWKLLPSSYEMGGLSLVKFPFWHQPTMILQRLVFWKGCFCHRCNDLRNL